MGASGSDGVPLCVDLDGTLVAADLLVLSLGRLLRRSPWTLLRLVPLLGRSRALFKRRVFEAAPVDAAAVPYRASLVAWLSAERSAGRRLVLATASDAAAAAAVAGHLGLFDEVLASDGRTNLKGEAKRARLVARFGERGFDYVGDSRADLPVFRSARRVGVAGKSAGVRRAAERLGRLERTFS